MEFILTGIITVIVLALLACTVAQDILASLLAFLQEKTGWHCERAGKAGIGAEGLLDQTAIVKTEFVKQATDGLIAGKVFVHGELWSAVLKSAPSGVPKPGDEVRVVGVEGLTVEIDPMA